MVSGIASRSRSRTERTARGEASGSIFRCLRLVAPKFRRRLRVGGGVTRGPILHLGKAKNHQNRLMFTRLGQLCKLMANVHFDCEYPDNGKNPTNGEKVS